MTRYRWPAVEGLGHMVDYSVGNERPALGEIRTLREEDEREEEQDTKNERGSRRKRNRGRRRRWSRRRGRIRR